MCEPLSNFALNFNVRRYTAVRFTWIFWGKVVSITRVARGVPGGETTQRTRAEPEQRPHGGELPRAVRVGVAGRRAGEHVRDGKAQRGTQLEVRVVAAQVAFECKT
jgi:hypothetical protein